MLLIDHNNQPVRFPAVSKTKPQSNESAWHSLGSLLEANFKELDNIFEHKKKK